MTAAANAREIPDLLCFVDNPPSQEYLNKNLFLVFCMENPFLGVVVVYINAFTTS